MASCVVVTAIICVLLTTVATIVAFATPNWLKFRDSSVDIASSLCKCEKCDCGLWMKCAGSPAMDSASLDNCNTFFAQDNLIEKSLPDWFKAVQGLMSCAVACALISLFIGLFSLCCSCKCCNPHQAAGAFINLTFLLLAAGVCVFGAKAHMDNRARVMAEANTVDPLFSWSFWCAVGAAGMSLISSVLYFCVGRADDYSC
ncbi:uncharacterized protein LOC124262401 [Haliotis rubra]|uniref:uncharacterized protein LOC124262401 n=1 Tax=Haliotis rubra TaxID=36100 RepID=UPI001EE60230|nr:uncharacterized protein LOC124262401 [Haliotis rubra]